MRLHSGDSAKKPDSIISHQLLLPLKGCFLLPGTVASQMLVTRDESGISDLGQPCTAEKGRAAASSYWSRICLLDESSFVFKFQEVLKKSRLLRYLFGEGYGPATGFVGKESGHSGYKEQSTIAIA